MNKVVVFTFLLSIFLYACQEHETVFSSKKTREGSWYQEPTIKFILVEHAPKDRNRLKRLIIKNWLQEIAMPLDSLRLRSDIKYFSIYYLKSTYYTREYFAHEPRHYHWEDCYNYKTVLGCIDIDRCENTDNKINVYLKMKIGKIDIKEHQGYNIINPPLLDIDTLVYECDSAWYEKSKDNELVKYYEKLKQTEETHE